MTHPPLSASDLRALTINKHYWCDEFTKVGTAIGVVLVGRTYEVEIRWWWGCQTPVAVPFEELELIESFACSVKFVSGKLQERLGGSKKKRKNKKGKKSHKNLTNSIKSSLVCRSLLKMQLLQESWRLCL